MVVSGHPGYQAAQQVTAVTANVLFAVALLPFLGIEGAALGTAASYFVGIFMLIVFARRLLGWNLIFNRPPISI
jgi:Na+-driven multidrug efflux pump